MTPESPQPPRPEQKEGELSCRGFLVGSAAMASGLVPERAEAVMSPEDFHELLMTIEGPDDLKNAVFVDYQRQSEAMRYLMHRQFQKCHPDDVLVFVGYDGPGRIDVECRKREE